MPTLPGGLSGFPPETSPLGGRACLNWTPPVFKTITNDGNSNRPSSWAPGLQPHIVIERKHASQDPQEANRELPFPFQNAFTIYLIRTSRIPASRFKGTPCFSSTSGAPLRPLISFFAHSDLSVGPSHGRAALLGWAHCLTALSQVVDIGRAPCLLRRDGCRCFGSS